MSTDDFVFSTLIAGHPDPATASRALQMAEAAVLRRAADAINALPQDFECDPGWGNASERLRATAAGIEEKTGPAPTVVSHEAYPGELAMFRGLVRTLRVAARFEDIAEVQRLLHHHTVDETAAYAEQRGKGSRTPADATPAREQRLAQLLAAIRTHRGEWRSGRVQELRRLTGGPITKGFARSDLAELHRRGHLKQHGPQDGRFYTLASRKDDA